MGLGAKDVVGTSIHVDGEPRTVIGVMPRGFSLVPWADNIAFWAANDLRRIPEARWMLAVWIAEVRPYGESFTTLSASSRSPTR